MRKQQVHKEKNVSGSRQKKADEYVDGGETFYNMNIKGTKWYMGEDCEKPCAPNDKVRLTFKERLAIFRAGICAALPYAAIFMGIFGLLYFVSRLWLGY